MTSEESRQAFTDFSFPFVFLCHCRCPFIEYSFIHTVSTRLYVSRNQNDIEKSFLFSLVVFDLFEKVKLVRRIDSPNFYLKLRCLSFNRMTLSRSINLAFLFLFSRSIMSHPNDTSNIFESNRKRQTNRQTRKSVEKKQQKRKRLFRIEQVNDIVQIDFI